MPDAQSQQPHIVTDWVSDDDSAHRLETALTNGQAQGVDAGPIIAIRNTQQPNHVLTCTGQELRQFAQSAQQGAIGKMLTTAGKGRPGQ